MLESIDTALFKLFREQRGVLFWTESSITLILKVFLKRSKIKRPDSFSTLPDTTF